MITSTWLVDKYIGNHIPYLDNGRDPKVGLDCWGLVLNVVHDIFGIWLTDTDYKWNDPAMGHDRENQKFHVGDKTIDVSDFLYPVKQPKFGDVLDIAFLFENWSFHAGVYIGGMRFMQSVYAHGVVVSKMIGPYIKLNGIYRVKL